MNKVLVTGAAGFIGSYVSLALVKKGETVVGLDNINDYYDVSLKEARLRRIKEYCQSGATSGEAPGSFRFEKMDITDGPAIADLFAREKFDKVINLAAQAGVRYSLTNPRAYIDNNIVGFLNILEGCHHTDVSHLVYASSSSVYGANEKLPFSVHDNVDHPFSMYAATKKSNELMAHAYSHLYQMPVTGLRFFTVYGPWGRPDMALFLFTRAILEGKPINVYNFGHHKRDFTYIDDIVEGVVRVLDRIPEPDLEWSGFNPDPASSRAPWRIFNIGNSNPAELLDYISVMESCLGRKAEMNLLPIQPGDVPETYADVTELFDYIGYKPGTTIEEGVRKFVRWYLEFYNTE